MNTSKDNKWRDGKALERYTLIAPLLEGSLDPAKRLQMREDIASRNGISLRSLYRYEAAFKKEGFSGLKPAERPKQHSAKLPDNFKEILEQAVQLKREVPDVESLNYYKIFLSQGKTKEEALKILAAKIAMTQNLADL